MLNNSWTNPWKLTTIGLGLIVATAAATSLVVANRTGRIATRSRLKEVQGVRRHA